MIGHLENKMSERGKKINNNKKYTKTFLGPFRISSYLDGQTKSLTTLQNTCSFFRPLLWIIFFVKKNLKTASFYQSIKI